MWNSCHGNPTVYTRAHSDSNTSDLKRNVHEYGYTRFWEQIIIPIFSNWNIFIGRCEWRWIWFFVYFKNDVPVWLYVVKRLTESWFIFSALFKIWRINIYCCRCTIFMLIFTLETAPLCIANLLYINYIFTMFTRIIYINYKNIRRLFNGRN